MPSSLRFNIADQRLAYQCEKPAREIDEDYLIEFNHLHSQVLNYYDITLTRGTITRVFENLNGRSNLGALRNRQLRQSVIMAAALSAAAVRMLGFGSLRKFPEAERTKALSEELKRANDRTAAQVMGEVLQFTTETFPVGEEVVIESAVTEGVRVKPGKEAGGNPTIAVGALFGKDEHRAQYGLSIPSNVTMLSMGNDVIDGTTKSIKGLHSSLTALFLTESGVKRHLPDIYTQRWMAGAYFQEFDPREATLLEAAEIMAKAYGLSRVEDMSAYFLDRSRHYLAMDTLNQAGICTPFDQDGDLFPAIVLGDQNLRFPDGRGFWSMIGEIGGSAEWAVGVLPLVWRGGQAIGMLTSQSTMTRKDLSDEQVWNERFHYTEEELMLIHDARFQHKPHFTIDDILERPFAGGVSAFGAISDNYFYPSLKGVQVDDAKNEVAVNVMMVNSLGLTQHWHLVFQCRRSLAETARRFTSPKVELVKLSGADLARAIGEHLADPIKRKRFRIFFINEYYPAIIHVREQMVLLWNSIDTLIQRGALQEKDREITQAVAKLAPEWFVA